MTKTIYYDKMFILCKKLQVIWILNKIWDIENLILNKTRKKSKSLVLQDSLVDFDVPLQAALTVDSVLSSTDSTDFTGFSSLFFAAHFTQLDRPFPSFPPQIPQPLVQRVLHSSSLSPILQYLQLPWEDNKDDNGGGQEGRRVCLTFLLIHLLQSAQPLQVGSILQ